MDKEKKHPIKIFVDSFSIQIVFTNTKLNIDQQKGFPTGSPAMIPKPVAPPRARLDKSQISI
jgi:hypothetical protein